MKIVLFNGPPRSGKDAAADYLVAEFAAQKMRFAQAVKEIAHWAYCAQPLDHDHFEEVKDTPLDIFMGKTPRQIYIAVSEQLMKPLHGPDIFGQILRDRIQQELDEGTNHHLLAIPDSGFAEEIEVLANKFGAENITLVRLYRDGCDFGNDSRSHVHLYKEPGIRIKQVDVRADDLDELRAKLNELIEDGTIPIADLKPQGQWLTASE